MEKTETTWLGGCWLYFIMITMSLATAVFAIELARRLGERCGV
jgi:hypothetical protein